ncbi:cartilage-associated protein-like isoform X6 [Toxorhynchites rutilus septentrionalis]|nr:cartilage-associated protein-like isoform X6 [Toxorhynchites rutilus septentrionalis]
MQFIFDENQCRAFCEGEFDHGFIPDFISSIGNHFTNTLYCKRNCTRNMEMVRGKYYKNLFSEHYRYLQLAYLDDKQYEESYRAGLSYLVFNEGDSDMLNALKDMEEDTKITLNDNFFKVRREADEYYNRMAYEEKIIDFIRTEFDENEDKHGNSTNDLPNLNDSAAADQEQDEDEKHEEEWRQTGTVQQEPNKNYLRDEL